MVHKTSSDKEVSDVSSSPIQLKLSELQAEYRRTGEYSIVGLIEVLGKPNYQLIISPSSGNQKKPTLSQTIPIASGE